MRSHTEYLVFETRKRREMVHITDQVEPVSYTHLDVYKRQ